jgi:hypothetical protein
MTSHYNKQTAHLEALVHSKRNQVGESSGHCQHLDLLLLTKNTLGTAGSS